MQKSPSVLTPVGQQTGVDVSLTASNNKSPTTTPIQPRPASQNQHPIIQLGPIHFSTDSVAPFPGDTELRVLYQKPSTEKYLKFQRGLNRLTGKIANNTACTFSV
jgi:hypothetical protein